MAAINLADSVILAVYALHGAALKKDRARSACADKRLLLAEMRLANDTISSSVVLHLPVCPKALLAMHSMGQRRHGDIR